MAIVLSYYFIPYDFLNNYLFAFIFFISTAMISNLRLRFRCVKGIGRMSNVLGAMKYSESETSQKVSRW